MKIKIVERVIDTSIFHTGSFAKRYTLYRRFLFLFWREVKFPMADLLETVEAMRSLYVCDCFLDKDFAIDVYRHCFENRRIKYRGYMIEPAYRSASFGYRVVVSDSYDMYDGISWLGKYYNVFSSLTVDGCKEYVDKIVEVKENERYEREYWKEEIVEI